MKNLIILLLSISVGIMWYLDVSPSEFIYLMETLPNYIKYEVLK
jgi:hypothetical protein|tara:strand:- start:351 stop:482 length:132 start_codon:yes stop_codon:yes gene_type:complete